MSSFCPWSRRDSLRIGCEKGGHQSPNCTASSQQNNIESDKLPPAQWNPDGCLPWPFANCSIPDQVGCKSQHSGSRGVSSFCNVVHFHFLFSIGSTDTPHSIQQPRVTTWKSSNSLSWREASSSDYWILCVKFIHFFKKSFSFFVTLLQDGRRASEVAAPFSESRKLLQKMEAEGADELVLTKPARLAKKAASQPAELNEMSSVKDVTEVAHSFETIAHYLFLARL